MIGSQIIAKNILWGINLSFEIDWEHEHCKIFLKMTTYVKFRNCKYFIVSLASIESPPDYTPAKIVKQN